MKTAKQLMMEELLLFSQLYQLPLPTPEYVEAIQFGLRAHKWTLGDFKYALSQLTTDEEYAESAKFGKYPTIFDFIRVKKQRDSQSFYKALSAYLAGDWWEKDTIKQLATPEQHNAILLAGGLENLHARATGEKPTPIYKLVELVIKNEAKSPVDKIDTTARIGAPVKFNQIADLSKND